MKKLLSFVNSWWMVGAAAIAAVSWFVWADTTIRQSAQAVTVLQENVSSVVQSEIQDRQDIVGMKQDVRNITTNLYQLLIHFGIQPVKP